MNLGQYVATIEANISNFERNIDKADSVYNSFAKKNIYAEKKRIEAIKNYIEQETGIRVNSTKEIEAITSKFTAYQISQAKKQANAYVTHSRATERESERRARKAEQDSFRVQRALQREAEQVEQLRRKVLQWSTLAITVPIVFGTKKAMQDFIVFQSELYNVKAVTGATTEEMQKMTTMALEMSQVFSKTGKEIATAFLQLGQAGYEASEILTSAKDVMLLSSAGMKDIDFTAELVVTTLKAFNLEANESARIIDVFASSAAKSVSSLDKISASLKYTAGLWGSQNWEIENLIGILDVLFDTGVRGEKAGRLLASAVNGLQKPTAGASKVIQKLLGDVNALSPAMNDVTSIVKKLANANATTAEIFQIFGKEGTDVMLRLIQNVGRIDEAIAEVTGQTGEAAKQATIQMQSLGSQWDILKNKVTAFSKQVIGFMEPMFKTLVKGAGEFFDAINKMPDWLKTIVTLGSTFALLGAPVAGLALKVKEFTAIMKIAGVTASATGLALKTAFPIMALVGVAVGGIATAYAYSAKKHQEWIDSVNSGIDKLAEEKKSLNDMVKEIEKLYSTAGNTKEVTDRLKELGEVFPELRKYINQNADDTAGAMAKLYEELAKLNTEKAKLAETQSDVATTTRDKNIAELNKELYTLEGRYNTVTQRIVSANGALENIVNVVNKAFGGTKESPVVTTLKDATIKLAGLGTASKEYIKIMEELNRVGVFEETNTDELVNLQKKINSLKVELRELQKRGQVPIATTPVLSDKYSLQEAIGEVVEKIKKQYGTFDIQITAGTAEAESIIKSFGDIANSELLLIKEKYRKELMEVGAITPSGDWAEGFLAYMEEGAEKVSLAFDGSLNDAMDKLLESSKSLLTGASVAGLDDALKIVEIKQAINANEVILAGLNKDKIEDADQYIKLTKENDEYKKQEVELAKNVNAQTRDALRILFGFIIEAEKLSGSGGTLNKQLDWWGQIKKQISDIKDLLKGTEEITSLTDVMNQLSSATGKEYDKVIALGKALSGAFTKNPRLKWYADNFDIVNSVMDVTIKKLRDLEIQQLKNAGVDTSIPEFTNQLEEAGDKAEQLAKQLEEIQIKAMPLDMVSVTESIEKIKEEILKSGEVDFSSLFQEMLDTQAELLEEGKTTKEVNDELLKIYGKQSVELFNQTLLAQQLEIKYKKLKEKYGDGIIELISKKQLNDAIDAEEQLLVAIGQMGKAQAEVNKQIRERENIIANNKAIEKMTNRIRSGVAEIEEFYYITEELNKDKSFSGLLKNLDVMLSYLGNSNHYVDNLLKKLKEAEELKDEELIKKIKVEIEIAKANQGKMLSESFEGLIITLQDIIDLINNTINQTKGALEAWKKLNDEGKESENHANNVHDLIGKIGFALGPVTVGIGTLVGLIMEMAKGLVDVKKLIEELIWPTPDLSYMQEEFEKQLSDAQKLRDIENAVYGKYLSLGEGIGRAIAEGIKTGTVDVETIIKTQLYDMIAQQILVSGGYAEKIARIAQKTTTQFIPYIDEIDTLSKKITGLQTDLNMVGNSVDLLDAINSKETQYKETDSKKIIEKWRSAFNEETEALKEGKNKVQKAAIDVKRGILKIGKEIQWAIDAAGEVKINKAVNAQLDIQIADLEQKYEKALDLERKIAKAQKELDTLTELQAAGIVTTTSFNINTSEINAMAAEYEDIMRQIYEVLDFQAAQVELEKNIRESLEGAFANAVLTGSYTDFKNAVYDMIVSNITQAIVSSGVVTNRLSSLVKSILDKATSTGETLTMDDVGAILNEVKSAWSEATDTTTPLGQLLMGLRDGLSEFGALDVNVNPGQVVTALPSEAINKLDQAFQDVANRLSQAITESGLNSHIDLVNITTAYIEKMTANSVVINSAIFDMSGDLVLNNISGATVGEFLENLIKEQVASAMP